MGLGLFPEAWGRALLADGSLFSAANLIASVVPLIAAHSSCCALIREVHGCIVCSVEKRPQRREGGPCAAVAVQEASGTV